MRDRPTDARLEIGKAYNGRFAAKRLPEAGAGGLRSRRVELPLSE